MLRWHVALGDRHEARESRLGREEVVVAGVKRDVRHPIADGEELPGGIEEEPKVGFVEEPLREIGEGHQAARDRSGGRPVVAGSGPFEGSIGRDGIQLEVPCVALDRAHRALRPRHELAPDALTALGREGPGDIGKRPGMRREGRQQGRPRIGGQGGVGGHCVRSRGERHQGLVEMVPAERLGAEVVTSPRRCESGELDRVPDAREDGRGRNGTLQHLVACLGEDKECRAQVAAVNRRYVWWVERLELPRVVPIEQVASVAIQAGHGPQTRLQTLDCLERADPAEVACAQDGQQVHPDVRR